MTYEQKIGTLNGTGGLQWSGWRVALATVERVAYEMNLARRVDCSGARALITGTALSDDVLSTQSL